MRVFAVEGEGGLAVGAGFDEVVAVALGEQLAEALGGDGAAAVFEGVGRHRQPYVFGQQGEQAVEVGRRVGAGELLDQGPLGGGVGDGGGSPAPADVNAGPWWRGRA